MKTKSTALRLKTVLLITFTIFELVSFTTCKAQSIVGSWKGVSTKYYYNEEYAKQIGKSTEEKNGKDFDGFDINYNAGNTFVMHITKPNSTEVMIMKGTWSLSGDKLTTTRELQFNPTKRSSISTILITGNKMIQTTEIMPPPSRIRQAITTCVKM